MSELKKLTIEEIREEILKLQNKQNKSNLEESELETLKFFERKELNNSTKQ